MNSKARALSLGSLRARWIMGTLWAAILVKCVLVNWAVSHWRMPFHAGWVILPTLVFAVLATGVWLAHRE